MNPGDSARQERPVLWLDDVTKQFDVRTTLLRRVIGKVYAVDHVSLTIGAGETVGLVGESGSGKSTLGRLALRVIEPTSGRVELGGVNITELSARKLRAHRRAGQMIFQDPYSSLDPRSTIADSVGEPLSVHLGLSRRQRAARVAELLEHVRLSGKLIHRYPHEFSGGQLQRVALARALAVHPELLVADEPVSSLDVSTQAQVIDVLEELQHEIGIACLFISHDLSVVRNISDRIAVMYLGRIVELGSASAVVAAPKHPYSAALLSAVPIPDPVVQRSRRRIILAGDLPNPSNLPSGCRFRTRCPFAMEVCAERDPDVFVAPDGTEVRCHLHTEGPVLKGSSVLELESRADLLSGEGVAM